jgi:hypothetical protein
MTTSYTPLCIVGNRITLRHVWSVRAPVVCLVCGVAMPKEVK